MNILCVSIAISNSVLHPGQPDDAADGEEAELGSSRRSRRSSDTPQDRENRAVKLVILLCFFLLYILSSFRVVMICSITNYFALYVTKLWNLSFLMINSNKHTFVHINHQSLSVSSMLSINCFFFYTLNGLSCSTPYETSLIPNIFFCLMMLIKIMCVDIPANRCLVWTPTRPQICSNIFATCYSIPSIAVIEMY